MIDQSRMPITKGENIYLKTPCISIEKRIKRHVENCQQRWGQDTRLKVKSKDTKNPRPRTHLPRTDPLQVKDMNARGQGQGPRTQRGSVLQEKKSSLKTFVTFPQKAGYLQTKCLCPKIPQNSGVKNVFRKFFGVLLDETILLMSLAHF